MAQKKVPEEFQALSTWKMPSLKPQEMFYHALHTQNLSLQFVFWSRGSEASTCSGCMGYLSTSNCCNKRHWDFWPKSLSIMLFSWNSDSETKHTRCPTSPCNLPWYIWEVAWASKNYPEDLLFFFFFWLLFLNPLFPWVTYSWSLTVGSCCMDLQIFAGWHWESRVL